VLQTLTTISKRVIRHRREETEREAASAAPARPSPPPGTSQFVVRMAEAEPNATPPPPVAPPRGVPPELLARAADASANAAAAEAEALFEPSLREAPPLAAAADEMPVAPDRLLRVESLGAPSLAGPKSLRVPVRVRDEQGHTREIALRIQIEAIEDEGP